MASQDVNQGTDTEIDLLRQEQVALRKHWLLWGFASNGVAIALCVAVLIRVAIIGDDPPSPMIFITLTYVFLGIVFITAGRSHTFPWFPRR
jgi:hypothetical protein